MNVKISYGNIASRKGSISKGSNEAILGSDRMGNSPAAAASSIGSNRCFTFLLANNTSNQFGVCLLLPRVFRDSGRGVLISCDYCVCIVTKLPFLSYLFNLLMQFDAQGGLDFSEPVQKQAIGVDSFLLFQPPALRLLIEFTRHLRDVNVPLYRVGSKYNSTYGAFNCEYDGEEDVFPEDDPKSAYQPVTFSMALKSATPKGSFSQLLDAISTPAYFQPVSHFTSGSTPSRPVPPKGSLTRRSLFSVFRRDLMGVYSALPLLPFNIHRSLPVGSVPEPPYLPSPRWPINESLLGLLEEDREKEVCFHTLLWALPALLRHLPLDQIILAIGCSLTEMRVVVVGEDLSVVSGCVLALVNLLRPLKWAGPVIVTLPSTLHAYLESPVPLILGMQSLPEGFKIGPGIIMIDPKVHTAVQQISGFTSISFLFLLPHLSLCGALPAHPRSLELLILTVIIATRYHDFPRSVSLTCTKQTWWPLTP